MSTQPTPIRPPPALTIQLAGQTHEFATMEQGADFLKEECDAKEAALASAEAEFAKKRTAYARDPTPANWKAREEAAQAVAKAVDHRDTYSAQLHELREAIAKHRRALSMARFDELVRKASTAGVQERIQPALDWAERVYREAKEMDALIRQAHEESWKAVAEANAIVSKLGLSAAQELRRLEAWELYEPNSKNLGSLADSQVYQILQRHTSAVAKREDIRRDILLSMFHY